ncbi:FecR family protein [Tenacibaculum sp. 190524A02b]|uniref:Transmembrane sensor n=1 Tax=Tenacibaculum vairaonense TaxID=3137860 RepID=A0ABM9PH10_9FLAO
MSQEKFTYLMSKWIEGTLSKKELQSLEQFEEFDSYKRILEGANGFYTPEINNHESYINFTKKIKNPAIINIPKKKKSKLYPIIAIAASLALLIAFFIGYNKHEVYKTNTGEQLAILLPDSSQAILNSKSSLSFSRKNWHKKRSLKLQGEGYFKVKKGKTFKVSTSEGDVQVLGTEFNIKTYPQFIEVTCFEGKVAVSRNNSKLILTEGNVAQWIDTLPPEKWNTIQKQPSWQLNESNFKNLPFKLVLAELEKVFGVHIIITNVNTTQKISGSFPNDNLKLAVESLAESLSIQCQISLSDKKVHFFK